MILGELVVVDAENDGQVGAVSRSRNDDALGAGGQVHGSLVARGEDAGALHRDVDAEFLVRERCRVLDRGDLDRLATTYDDGVALDLHIGRKLAVDAVIAQQVRVGFNRAEVVDGDDLDVGPAGFDDCAQYVAADAAKAIYGNFHSHCIHSRLKERPSGYRIAGRSNTPCDDLTYASFASAAATIASAVMPKCL